MYSNRNDSKKQQQQQQRIRQLTKTPSEFIHCIQQSDLNVFKFTENFLFDIWTIVHDVLHTGKCDSWIKIS